MLIYIDMICQTLYITVVKLVTHYTLIILEKIDFLKNKHMIYLGILIGFILGLPIGFIKWKKKSTPVVEKYSRRGLLQKNFSVTDNLTNRKNSVDVQYEIGELESTDKLSKIEVIVLKADQSEYNSEYNKKRLLEMVDKTWVSSDDITWITTAADKRNKKIEEILN
jgi:hypothetical protein